MTDESTGQPRQVEAWQGGALEWFPKAFGPGDIDGIGARRLLGQPKLDLTDLLVREMAQNAWDARDDAGLVEFTINYRRLSDTEKAVLRQRVFTGNGDGLGLREFLEREDAWCLEVSDRGTVGLDGPTRNDLTVEKGQPRNFIDLVFNIGAPRDVHLGGGTYGYGKTITYVSSSVSTVLIWSRCRTQGGDLEHRLIGSAMGEAFDRDGRSFTGRSWWGHLVEAGERIEPAVGDAAQRLAEIVFEARFTGEQTGTTFLIPDPQLTGETAEEKADGLARSVLVNLWPKLLTEQTGRARMKIRVMLEGQPLAIPAPERLPAYSGYARCLQTVRKVQAGEALAEEFEPFIRVVEIRSQRPKALLGHLALAREPVAVGQQPAHAVALMRHEAELVVKYEQREKLDVPGYQWMGVFKPTAEVDNSFAASEPPAHDDWVPDAMQNPTQKRHVNIGLRNIRAEITNFLTPRNPEADATRPKESVAHIGDMLSGLVAGAIGSAPDRRQRDRSGKRSTGNRPAVVIEESSHWEEIRPGWSTTILKVSLEGASADNVSIQVVPRVGIDGGSLPAEDAIVIHGWGANPEGGPWSLGPLELSTASHAYFCYEHGSELSIDIRATIEEVR